MIRTATLQDCDLIAAFNAQMAEETEGRILDPEILRAGVAALLQDPNKGTYYIYSDSQGRILGQVMVTLEWSDWRSGYFWWIQSVYVAPYFRGQGIFKALYHHILHLAQEKSDVCGLRLYVERTNHAARKTYAALGMKETEYRLYELEFT